MKPIILTLIVLTLFPTAWAQKSKKTAPKKKPAAHKPSPPAPTGPARIVGSKVYIETKNGDRIAGELLDLTAYSIRLRSDNLESTIALDTISQLSFGTPVSSRPARVEQTSAVRGEFLRDADVMLSQFGALATTLKSGSDYTEYGRQLSEVRRSAERFITKYSTGDNASEARVLSLMTGALTDYTWARTIWTLKFGRSSDGTVTENDSPLLSDALALYPDLRTSAATENKLSVDKVVGGLWRKAADKLDRARALSSYPR
ncbi:MAG TPA: hypothetical protein VFB82_10585 [Blastocatellia bacterium]|nr:hypothetical protein [Blastocatellia bacterium]